MIVDSQNLSFYICPLRFFHFFNQRAPSCHRGGGGARVVTISEVQLSRETKDCVLETFNKK